MKKQKYITIGIVAVIVIVAVLAIFNPMGFGSNNLTPGNNTTNGNNSTVEIPGTTWIGPGKVYLDDDDHIQEARGVDGRLYNYTVHGLGLLSYNEEFKCNLQIHNGGNQTAVFSVDYRYPDGVEAGYTRLSSDIRQWVYIKEKKPSIAPGETRNVPISLYVPLGANITGGKFEFWIGVIDQSQTGMIITELAQRWLVTMG